MGFGMLAGPAAAQDWSPFDPFNNPARGQQKPPPREREAPPVGGSDDIVRPLGDGSANAVERGDLTPVMAADGSGLPYELWRGLDVGTLSRLISEIDIPPRSQALHQLWLRLITSNVTPPDGGVTDQQFLALRLEILYRSGLLQEAAKALANMPAGDPTVAILAARNEIGLGAQDRGCETVKAGGAPAQLPKPIKGDAALIAGFCSAVAGDAPGAGLAAEMAREEGVKDSPGLQALDAISMGAKPQVDARPGDHPARLSADRSGRRRGRRGARTQARRAIVARGAGARRPRRARPDARGRRSSGAPQRHLASAARRHLPRPAFRRVP